MTAESETSAATEPEATPGPEQPSASAPDPALAADPAPEPAPKAAKADKAAPKPGSFADLQVRGKALGLKVVGITKGALEAAIAAADPTTAAPVPLAVQEAVAATKAAAKAGHPVEVAQGFTTIVHGEEVNYRQGELIHPDDPVLARSPELFRPVVYQHPVRRA